MKRKLLILFLALGPALFAQSADPSGRDRVVKVVRVHGDAGVLAHLAGQNSGASVEGSEELKAVVIKGSSSDVAAVERTIQQLDAANSPTADAKNVEVVVYVVGGSMEPMSGTVETSGDALAPVLKQLRAVFPYKNYQTLSTMVLRSGQGSRTISSGMLKTLQGSGDQGEVLPPSTYQIQYESARVSGDISPLIHLSKFRFEAKIPVVYSSLKGKDGSSVSSQFQQISIGTESDVDLREGQKVVVANSNLGNINVSLFLVLTARLIQ